MLKNETMKSFTQAAVGSSSSTDATSRSGPGSNHHNQIDWVGRNGNGTTTKLYDRETQVRELHDAYQRSRTAPSSLIGSSSFHLAIPPELCLITGSSGTGKTALARSLQSRVEDQDRGFFLSGKFDDEISKPHGPFLAAVEEFIDKLKDKDKEKDLAGMRQAIREAVGSELSLLLEAIPRLSDILEDEEPQEQALPYNQKSPPTDQTLGDSSTSTLSWDTTRTDSERSFKIGASNENPARFVSVFCRFLAAIASQSTLVLLLDDLQWSDGPSLDILRALLLPSSDHPILHNNHSLMLIGTCRGNEVDLGDALAVLLRDLEERGTLITDIQVTNLTPQAMACLIADALDLDDVSECLPLAEIVHGQTDGNVFFCQQYLQSLRDEGILYQDDNTNQWKWDEAALVLTLPPSATTNNSCSGELIIKLLARKLQQLPPDVVHIVQVIACMGSTFSVATLVPATTMTVSQVQLALEVAATNGFIVYDQHLGSGYIPHDKFREAPLSLIEARDKPMVHLTIGRNLRRQLTTALVKAHVILIVDQLKHGLDLLTDDAEDERDDFCRLFLRASKEAAKQSAFLAASEYVDYGISILGHRHWRDQYNLSIDLYSTGAELAYCIGDTQKVESLATAVIQNARSLVDKNQAVVTLAMSVGGRGESTKAIHICRTALQEHNFGFPKHPTEFHTLMELVRVRAAIGRRTEEDILALPELQDPKIMTAMKVFYIMFNLLESMNSKASALPVFRLVRLTLQHGLSPLAGLGFHLYGVCLVKLGYLEDGYRFAQLANKIMERFPSKQLEGQVGLVFASAVLPSKFSIRECIEPIWNAGVVAMEVGNIEMGVAGRAFACSHRLLIGDPIPEIQKVLKKSSSLCQTHGQYKVGIVTKLTQQLAENLQGCSVVKDPLNLTGSFMHERETIDRLKEGDMENLLVLLLHYKYMLATLMNENKYADELYQRQKAAFKGFLMPFLPLYNRLFRGLVYAALARESAGWQRRRKLAAAKRQYTRLKENLVHCPNNCVNKMYLLDAELEFCHGRFSSALLKYDRAIASAQKEGFVSDQAIACEKAGRMLHHAGRSSEAEEYLDQARLLYMEWGAQVKVDQMVRMRSNITA